MNEPWQPAPILSHFYHYIYDPRAPFLFFFLFSFVFFLLFILFSAGNPITSFCTSLFIFTLLRVIFLLYCVYLTYFDNLSHKVNPLQLGKPTNKYVNTKQPMFLCIYIVNCIHSLLIPFLSKQLLFENIYITVQIIIQFINSFKIIISYPQSEKSLTKN